MPPWDSEERKLKTNMYYFFKIFRTWKKLLPLFPCYLSLLLKTSSMLPWRKVREKNAHWIENSWAFLGVFSHDSAKRPHRTHQCEEVGRSMWEATSSILNEQPFSLPPSKPFKSGREWLICSEHPLDRGLFPLLDFLRKHLQTSPNTDWKPFSAAISPSGQTPCTLSPWTIKRWSSQEITGWHEAQIEQFSLAVWI